jgi:hypothetical protein
MITLLLLFALKVVSPGEMACVGSVQELTVPEDVYIAGVNDEGTTTFGSTGQILYLNGPGVSSLKTGTVQRVIRPEGRVRDPLTNEKLGTYYKDIGTIRIEAVEQESATARILLTCEGMLKGDIVIPNMQRPVVEFNGSLSNALTPLQGGLAGPILLGKNDAREMAVGQFCFIQLGRRDGVKPGDRFVAIRPNPAFNAQDMDVAGGATDALYSSVRGGFFSYKVDSILRDRALPPKVLGDIVIVEVGEGIATGKIINSIWEIHPGDLVVKR